MLAAHQAALNTFVNNQNPQQGSTSAQPGAPEGGPPGTQPHQQPQNQHQHPNAASAAAHQQAAVYAMHAPPMLAYMPVLVRAHATCVLLCIMHTWDVARCTVPYVQFGMCTAACMYWLSMSIGQVLSIALAEAVPASCMYQQQGESNIMM